MKDLNFYLQANAKELRVEEIEEGIKLLATARDSFEKYEIIRGSKEYLSNILTTFGSNVKGYFTNKQMKESIINILNHRLSTYSINLIFKTQMN